MQDSQFRAIRSNYGTRKFMFAWLFMTFTFLSMLYAVGLAPRTITEFGDALVSPFVPEAIAVEVDEPYIMVAKLPSMPHIIIPKLGINVAIMLPVSTDINILNSELLKGVVHYPGSALPDENGNVFLFGHSTGLTVVHNKNFEVFNRIQELSSGDIVRIQYGTREFWYRVTSVSTEKASEALIDLRPDQGRKLTLSTCNVFGAKEDRFVVEAEFVRSYPLRSENSALDTSS